MFVFVVAHLIAFLTIKATLLVVAVVAVFVATKAMMFNMAFFKAWVHLFLLMELLFLFTRMAHAASTSALIRTLFD